MSLETQLAQKADEIAAKRAALAKLYDGVGDTSGITAQDRTHAIKAANVELNTFVDEYRDLDEQVTGKKANAEAIKAMRQPATQRIIDDSPTDDQPRGIKSLGDLLREATGYQNALKNGTAKFFKGDLGELPMAAFKTLSTTADMVGQTQRLPLVLDVQESRSTADLMLQGTTSATNIEYYEETTFTNGAVEVPEGGLKPESAVDFTLVTEAVRKIATWIPITDEMLADNEGFESYLRGRLGFMVKQREERQLLVGDGTAPNISGITDRSGIQTQAKGSDPVPDAFYKAITKVRNTGFAEPTAIVMHPNDWEPIRLLRTLDGIYILGSPTEAGPERLWGLPVRITSNMTENTGLVGAFRPDAQIFRKGGIELAISDSHSDYFIYNKLAVRAEERLALAVYRPASFCTVTGI